MRIIFMGTPDFAVSSLEILIQHKYNVVAIVTAPDKPAGRGLQLQQSAVKVAALKNNIPVLQPEKLKDEQFIEQLKSYAADLQIVVAFRMLPEVVWNMPKLGTYNLHASLLPKYRGAAPINWAIINGETKTGVTTFKLQQEIDTGNILFQEQTPITDEMTAGELHDNLMKIGSQLVLKSVQAIEDGNYTLQTQNDELAIHAPKLFKDTCKINWDQSSTTIYNLVRGLSPYPTAYTELVYKDGTIQPLKLFKCIKETITHTHSFGNVLSDKKTFLKIACNDGYISLTEVQLSGKKKMLITDFLRGFNFDTVSHCI